MQSDNPIKNSGEDVFERKAFASRIAEIIVKMKEPESVVIGLHAPWGEGKSSVLLMVKEALQAHVVRAGKTLLNGDLVLFEFNPWRYPNEETLLSNFFSGLAEHLDGRITTGGERISDLVKKYSFATAPLDTVKISAFGLIDLSLDSQKLLEKIADAKAKAGVDELKSRIEKILLDCGKRIVIVMDDIDRLDKHEIHAVFRLVKLTAQFPNTHFLLSFDPERVAEALKDQYGSPSSARSFLEKIVQLELSLPPITSDMLINFLYSRINALLEECGISLNAKRDEEWSYFFRSSFIRYLSSPRQVKRYLNALWFSLTRMKEEVDILDLQTLIAIRTFIPDLFELIRDNKQEFLVESSFASGWKSDDSLLEGLRSYIAKFPAEQRSNIQAIIGHLFPRAIAAFSNSAYGREWYPEWRREKRIAAPDYFDRYFQYGISKGDISDVDVGRLLSSIENHSDEENVAGILELVTNNRERLFIDKINAIGLPDSEQGARKLARALALSGQHFPPRDDRFLGPSSAGYAARCIRKIVEGLPSEAIERFAVEIATIAEPLPFAYEFLKQALYIGVPPGTQVDRSRPSVLTKKVQDAVVDRIVAAAMNANIDDLYPHFSEEFYRTWMLVDRPAVLRNLESKLTGDPEAVRRFILHRYHQGWDANSTAVTWGLPFIVAELEKYRNDNQIPDFAGGIDEDSGFVDNEDSFLAYFLVKAKRCPAGEADAEL